MLHVSRQAFSKCLKAKDAPWKCQALADAMIDICSEDECSDTCGRIRMYQALQPKQPEGVHIPGGRTVYRVMEDLGKCVTDMTGIKAPDGKWYVSAIFDCYDLAVLGLAMDTNIIIKIAIITIRIAISFYHRHSLRSCRSRKRK